MIEYVKCKHPTRYVTMFIVKSIIVMCLVLTGCYAEFDLGAKTPRKDPCTGVVEQKVVYVMPTCRYAPAPVFQSQ